MSAEDSALLLTTPDIAGILRRVGRHALMVEVIGALTEELRRWDERRLAIRKREGFIYGEPGHGLLEWMPLLDIGRSVMMKVVGYHPEAPARRGMATIASTLQLYDVETGRLLVCADGAALTAIRTGAASAVASRILARQDSRTVGLIGCGAQAVTQLHALSRVFSLERVLAFDAREATAHSLERRTRFLELPVSVVPRAQLEREADIVCTATTVPIQGGPVMSGEEPRPWLHVNAVGSDLPGKTELPRALLERSLVCPDFLPQAVVEGECQQLTAGQIGPSLADLVKDPAKVERHRERLTVFDSTGFALEDKVVLDVFLGHARRLGLGQRVHLEGSWTDAYDPYADPSP